MRENGEMEWQMVRARNNSPMAKFMKENGLSIKCMEKVASLGQMANSMLENFKMTCATERVN